MCLVKSSVLRQASADAAEVARLRPFEEIVKEVGQICRFDLTWEAHDWLNKRLALYRALHPERGAK